MNGAPLDHVVPERVNWKSAGAAIASISVVGITIGLGSPLLSTLLELRGYSATLNGLSAAVAGIAALAASPFTPRIALRFGVAPALAAAILAAAASFAGFYLFENYLVWLLLRLVLGFSLTMIFILSEFWMTMATPAKARGLVFGIYATILALGYAFGPWLFSQSGYAGFLPFGLAIGITLIAILPLSMAWNESPAISRREAKPFLPYLFKVPSATAAVLVFGAVETGLYALMPVFGARIGQSSAETAWIMTLMGLGNVVFQIPLGLISDRMQDRRLLLAIIAAFGLGGMLALPLVSGTPWLMSTVLFFWGGMIAGLYTVGLAHLGTKIEPHELASANAAFVACYAAGMILGPQLIGLGLDLAGPTGFSGTISAFFLSYLLLVSFRLAFRNGRG